MILQTTRENFMAQQSQGCTGSNAGYDSTTSRHLIRSAPIEDEDFSDSGTDFGKLTDDMVRLPDTFKPGEGDVICGRGRIALQHIGNRRYRDTINASLQNYLAATTKLEKSNTVKRIVSQIEHASPTGGFVKKIKGYWYKVSSTYAREKCGQR
jgi:hypothetical protein